MTKEQIELLLSRATDSITKQLLSEELRKLNVNVIKREKKTLKKESSLAKIVNLRRKDFYNWLTKAKANLVVNQTKQEVRIKALLKSLGITYQFQCIFMDGPNGYIPDFYLPSYNLIIEIDGFHHYTSDGKRKDKVRTVELIRYSKVKGVLRLTNRKAEIITDKELKELIINYKEKETNIIRENPYRVLPVIEKDKKGLFNLPQKQIDKMTKRGRKKFNKQ